MRSGLVRKLIGEVFTPVGIFLTGLLITLALFCPTLSGGYLSDDFVLIGLVRNQGPSGMWVHNSWFFRPQAAFLLWLSDHIAHQPWLPRLLCLTFFIIGVILIRQLTLRIARYELQMRGAEWTATFAALLFAFWPSHPEAVNWISCIGDDTGLAEGLLALLFALYYLRSTGGAKWGYFGAMSLSLALAMSAKEVFLLYPTLAILLGAVLLRHQTWRERLQRLIPIAALDIALVATFVYVHNLLGNQWGYPGQTSASRAAEVRNLSYDLPNAFLPVTDWITAGNQSLMLWPLAVLLTVSSVIVVRRVPFLRAPRVGKLAKIWTWCSANKHWLFGCWAAVNTYLAELWQTDPINETCYLVLVGAALIFTRKLAWSRVSGLVGFAFVGSCLLLIPREDTLLYDLFHLSGAFAIGRGKIAFFEILGYFYACRPQPARSNEEKGVDAKFKTSPSAGEVASKDEQVVAVNVVGIGPPLPAGLHPRNEGGELGGEGVGGEVPGNHIGPLLKLTTKTSPTIWSILHRTFRQNQDGQKHHPPSSVRGAVSSGERGGWGKKLSFSDRWNLMMKRQKEGRQPIPWTEKERDCLLVCAAFFGLAVLLLLPSMGVSTSIIQWDGQGQRLAFEASIFASIGTALLMTLFLAKWPKLLAGVAALILVAFATHLYNGNSYWVHAGRISSNVEPEMARVLASRPKHIYVLSNISLTGPVAVFSKVEDDLAKLASPGTRTQTYSGLYEFYHQPGDHVILEKADLKNMRFRLRMDGGPGEGPGPEVDAHRYRMDGDDLELLGFEPGDRIVYIDDDQLKVVL